MIRLGVAARVLGDPKLRASATLLRPGAEVAHLSRGLLQVRDILIYLQRHGIGCFRLPSTLLPFGPTTDATACAAALNAVADLCVEVGAIAQTSGLRLSIHPGLHVNFATPNNEIAARAAEEVALHAALLDALHGGPEAVIVLHVSGSYGEPPRSLQRFANRYQQLPANVRRRIVLEADEDCFDIISLAPLSRQYRIPLVFDSLHFQLHNPHRVAVEEALRLAIGSWPTGVRPKIHFSSQRTEAHLREAKGGVAQIVPPRRGQHSDYINPFEFIALLRAAHGLPMFDVMLEAKAADLALLRLRNDLQDLAPDLARQVG